jgi:hypothetical protein
LAAIFGAVISRLVAGSLATQPPGIDITKVYMISLMLRQKE